MCTAITLPRSELPVELIERAGLSARVHDRGGETEVRFYWRAVPALLPVWSGGRLQVIRWGNRDRSESRRPPTGWTWGDSGGGQVVGSWAGGGGRAATYGFANGVWFRVKQGMRRLLVRDRGGNPAIYLICEPAPRYYRVMTRADWMPVLVGEVI